MGWAPSWVTFQMSSVKEPFGAEFGAATEEQHGAFRSESKGKWLGSGGFDGWLPLR